MKRGTPDHPKMLALMSALGIKKYAAVGLMEMLWLFAARYAPRGDIGKYDNATLASAIGWDDDPDVMINGIIKAGFIDESEEYRLIIHDWSDHSDNAADRYLADHDMDYADGSQPRNTKKMNKLQKKKSVNKKTLVIPSNCSESIEKNKKSEYSHTHSYTHSHTHSQEYVESDKVDKAHMILKERPELSALTWEQDYLARRDHLCAEIDIDWVEIARKVSDLAILTGTISHPGVWLRVKYNQLVLELIDKNQKNGDGWDGLNKRRYEKSVTEV